MSTVSILSLYASFSFGILASRLSNVEEVVSTQLAAWGGREICRDTSTQNVRRVLDALDGPRNPPAVRRAMLLSRVDGPDGEKTLFVSSVADGYVSMISAVSAQLSGLHLAVEVSRLDSPFPKNAVLALQDGKVVRAVHAMKDTSGWVFYQTGEPLWFEDVSFYRETLKRSRVTPDIIASYLCRYGYGSLDLGFWTSSAAARIVYEGSFRFAAVSG